MNKKGSAGAILLAIVIIAVIGVLWTIGSYNGLVASDENVNAKWGNVQTAYQRRADLIPNLVETVKGAKNFEQSTLVQIAALRSQAGAVKQAVSEAKTPEEITAAGAQMQTVLDRLMVVVEAYPDIKSVAVFQGLMDELAGTENRIKYERDNYNSAVKDYKVSVRSFPTNMLAGMFGFSADKWTVFAAEAGSENAPNVTFE